MKIVASLEIKKEASRFVDVNRFVQRLADSIIKTLIEEKDCCMSETDGAKNPEALDLVMSYDEIIDSLEVRKWTSG
tara:strand:+ start:1231 stop:1458 length:228 start_codon:yes stop_codon:yes gene_type:complete